GWRGAEHFQEPAGIFLVVAQPLDDAAPDVSPFGLGLLLADIPGNWLPLVFQGALNDLFQGTGPAIPEQVLVVGAVDQRWSFLGENVGSRKAVAGLVASGTGQLILAGGPEISVVEKEALAQGPFADGRRIGHWNVRRRVGEPEGDLDVDFRTGFAQ